VPLLYAPSPVPFRPHAPTWRQPLYLHFDPLHRALARSLGTLSGRVLDVGCGMQPYRSLLGAGVSEYVGLDREGELSRPTVTGSADALPFADASFDAVYSTQVLEHVERPERALAEAARVLKPRGRLILTVPGVWPAHEVPHDFWRFTRFGIERMLQDARIANVEIEPLGGLWATVGQMVNLELARTRITRELVPIVNVAASWLDRRGAREELALAWLAQGTRAG
jgi:SAM-dependent methyltransferase